MSPFDTFAVLCVVSLLIATGATGLTGCGGAQSGKGHGGSPGETVYVEGKVSLRGSTPFELLLFEARDGMVYMIDTSPLADELKRLQDMTVGVTAKVLPSVKGDAQALSVVAYELLPLPTGERPILGVVVAASPDQVAMRTEEGATWVIEGGFKSVFLGLSGAKIWIVGDRQWAVNTNEGDVRSINVTQYGIIREPR
jgi:hypothetical protein